MTARERNTGKPVSLESVERLVRSLVGIADVHITAAPGGGIGALVVTPAPGAPERQVILNVTSGLLAGLGVALEPGSLTLAGPAAAEPSSALGAEAEPRASAEGAVSQAAAPLPSPAAAPAAASQTAAPMAPAAAAPAVAPVRLAARAAGPVEALPAQVPVPTAEHTTASTGYAETVRRYRRVAGRIVPAAPPGAAARVARHPAHAGATALAALDEAMPDAGTQIMLEQVELWPVEGRIRCRVTLAVGPDRFFGIADTVDLPGASLELPARVTVDALRAARVPDAPIQLDGVTVADIRGRHFVLAAVQVWAGQDFVPLAGAVAVDASYEEAAARAVLQALNSRNS